MPTGEEETWPIVDPPQEVGPPGAGPPELGPAQVRAAAQGERGREATLSCTRFSQAMTQDTINPDPSGSWSLTQVQKCSLLLEQQ